MEDARMASFENRVAAGAEGKEAINGIIVDKYNVEAAEMLASEAQCLPISEATPLYEQLLVTFPTAAKFWKQYVVAQMTANNEDVVKQIFSRCLLSCLQIPLWCSYINFIKKLNEKRGMDGQQETRKAYDFMLNYVGADIRSGPVWMEYINFLMSLPVLTTQDESQRMTGVRKAYQRAIVTPTHQVEQLWKDYENFENSVSRALAKGLLSEYQSKSNSAKAVYREQKKYVDEIDWEMLAVPPTGSYKEELQWIAWKRFLAFEKGNPQRIDSASSKKRIAFTYEQCLMYLYHFPDIWYDYATWHVKCGSFDAAAKVFQRALKALPDSEMLKYSYAELEESRGAIQPAKKIYESLLGDSNTTTALAHIQLIRFLRRTEGVEAARKHFLDARNSPLCTYHVYVAYAMMTYCIDKDPKIAHNVFEAGLKRFMHEPGYILEYADFLIRLNDDRNVRALFERALSSLPPIESVEVWKKFTQFEQTYGDLASMLKVERRMKEALSGVSEEGALDDSLQDVVSRYSFKDLWPCSSMDLDHLNHQEWLARNMNKLGNKSIPPNGSALPDKISSTPAATTSHTAKIIHPDTSRMLVCDPEQKSGVVHVQSTTAMPVPSASSTPADPLVAGGKLDSLDEMRKAIPPALISFLENLPIVEGPSPDVDLVLSICLQSRIPIGRTGKLATSKQLSEAPSCTGDLSGLSKSHSNHNDPAARHAGAKKARKIKNEGEGGGGCDESGSGQGMSVPRDVFRLRQLQKASGCVSTTSQTGSMSLSYGSATVSGDLSGSTG